VKGTMKERINKKINEMQYELEVNDRYPRNIERRNNLWNEIARLKRRLDVIHKKALKDNYENYIEYQGPVRRFFENKGKYIPKITLVYKYNKN